MKIINLFIVFMMLAACSEDNKLDDTPSVVITSYTIGNSTLHAYLEADKKVENVTSKNGVSCSGVVKPDVVYYTDKFFDEPHLSYEAEAYFLENCGKDARYNISENISDYTENSEFQFNPKVDLTDSFNEWIKETRELSLDNIKGAKQHVKSRINSAYLFGTNLINVSIKYKNGTIRNLGDYNIINNEWYIGFSIEDPERYFEYEKANEPFEIVYTTTYGSNPNYSLASIFLMRTVAFGAFPDWVESVHKKFEYFGTSEEYPPFLYDVGI